MAKRWRIHRHDVGLVTQLERRAGIPPVVAQLLVVRGVHDPQEAKTFLDAKLAGLRDPDELPGVLEASARIFAAVRERRRIVVYGDYDADGMSGTAVLYSCLRLLGADVGYYIPNRLDEGYGLNDEALRTLAGRGTSLVVSVDCGIASVREADTAAELGLELIVTDHHEFAASLPKAAVLVHPRLPGRAYPFGGLSGAGVAFKLAWSLCRQASQSKKVTDAMRDYLLTAIGIASIGTVADVVPLIDENRILVRHGLKSLKGQPTPGITALLKVGKFERQSGLSSEDIAFGIGPRLNAAGRLGQAELGVELLTTESAERALALAEYLDQLNQNRDSLERSIYQAARKQLTERFDPENDPAIVLGGSGWHPGVIGIVAGRLAEKYHRPVVLVAFDQIGVKPGTGSARTACGLNLHEALIQCDEHLLSHGGHAAAAGLKIEESRLEAFRAAFCEYVAQEVAAEARVPEIRIDAEAPFCQLTYPTVMQLEQLAPFGEGNPRPVLCATNVRLSAPPKKIGGGERHLALRLTQHNTPMRAMAFGQAEWADELAKLNGPIDVAFQPLINEYQGRRSVEIKLIDWRVSATTAKSSEPAARPAVAAVQN